MMTDDAVLSTISIFSELISLAITGFYSQCLKRLYSRHLKEVLEMFSFGSQTHVTSSHIGLYMIKLCESRKQTASN
jgi:hypothetical protein